MGTGQFANPCPCELRTAHCTLLVLILAAITMAAAIGLGVALLPLLCAQFLPRKRKTRPRGQVHQAP